MTTTLEFTEELYASLDEKGILAFHEKKQEYCIRVKIAEKVSMVPVFSERHKFHYMDNEIRDLLMNYYSFYYELMKQIIDEKRDPKFPEVMTAKQVQEFLQISNQTFYDLKNAGVIRTADIGPKRYLKSEIYKTLIDHLI